MKKLRKLIIMLVALLLCFTQTNVMSTKATDENTKVDTGTTEEVPTDTSIDATKDEGKQEGTGATTPVFDNTKTQGTTAIVPQTPKLAPTETLFTMSVLEGKLNTVEKMLNENEATLEGMKPISTMLWDAYQLAVQEGKLRPLTYNNSQPETLKPDFVEDKTIFERVNQCYEIYMDKVDAMIDSDAQYTIMETEEYMNLYTQLYLYRSGDAPTPLIMRDYRWRFLFPDIGGTNAVESTIKYKYIEGGVPQDAPTYEDVLSNGFTDASVGNERVQNRDAKDDILRYGLIIRAKPGYKFDTSRDRWRPEDPWLNTVDVQVKYYENGTVAYGYMMLQGDLSLPKQTYKIPDFKSTLTVQSASGDFTAASTTVEQTKTAAVSISMSTSNRYFKELTPAEIRAKGMDSYVLSNNNRTAYVQVNSLSANGQTVTLESIEPRFIPNMSKGIMGYSDSKSGTYNFREYPLTAGASKTIYVKANDRYFLSPTYSSSYISNYRVDADFKGASFTVTAPNSNSFNNAAIQVEPKAWLRLGDGSTPDAKVKYYSDALRTQEVAKWTNMIIPLKDGTTEPATTLRYYLEATGGHILPKTGTIISSGVTYTYTRTSPDGRLGVLEIKNITGGLANNYVGAVSYKSKVESYVTTLGTGVKFYKVENADGTFSSEVTESNKVENYVDALELIYLEAAPGTILPGSESKVKESNQFDGHSFVESYQVSADRKKAVVQVRMQTEEVTLRVNSYEGFSVQLGDVGFGNNCSIFDKAGVLEDRNGRVLRAGEELVKGQHYFGVKNGNVLMTAKAMSPNLVPTTWMGTDVSNIRVVKHRNNKVGMESPEEVEFTLGLTQDSVQQIEEAEVEVSAKDFMISLDDVKNLLVSNTAKEEFVALGKASVNITVDNRNVEIESVDYSKLKAATGEYKVTYSSLGVKKEVKVTVKNTVVTDIDTQEQIGANDIRLSKEETTKLLKKKPQAIQEELIGLTGAIAFDMTTGMEIAIDNVNYSSLISEKGDYALTFATAKRTTLQTKANVSDESGNQEKKEMIKASDFLLPLNEVEATIHDNGKLIALGKAKATDVENDIEVAITSVTHNIEKARGEYEVTYATENKTSITVLVLVGEEVENTDDYNKETIKASDFMLSVEDARAFLTGSLDEQKGNLIRYGGASAKSTVAPYGDIAITSTIHNIKADRGVYKVRYQTHKGTSVEIRVLVSDESSVEDIVVSEKIFANEFTLELNEVKTMDDGMLIKRAGAKAMDTRTGEEVAIANVTHTIQEKKGKYTVTFATAHKTSTTVQVNVKDEKQESIEGERIQASSFLLEKGEVLNVINDHEKLIVLGKVKATKMEDGSEVAISDIKHNIKDVRGVYEIKYATASGTSVSVQVLVSDEQEVISPTNKEKIKASDFMLSKDDTEKLLKKSAAEQLADLITHAGAQAENTETGASVAIEKANHNVEAKKGIYPITYQTAKGTSVTVLVLVSDQTIVEEEKSHEEVSANNFNLYTDEVVKMTSQQLISNANAIAVDKLTGAQLPLLVEHQIVAKKGVYPITFKTAKGTSITVQVMVLDKATEDIYTETIEAEDFMVTKEEVKQLTDQDIIQKAKAKAYIKETNEEVAITKVSHTIKQKRGMYTATFTSGKGMEMTVNVLVKEEVEVIDPITGETIKASDFMMSMGDTKVLLSKIEDEQKAMLINYGQVSAFDTATHANVEITKVTHDIIAERGLYEVMYETAQGTTVTINVMVSDKTIVENTKTEKLNANSFIIAKEEVGKLQETDLIRLAKAEAYIIETGEKLGIKISENNIKPEKGIYDVTFMTEKGTNVTVRVTVLDKAIEEVSTEVIEARDFMINKGEVAKITNEMLIEKAKVKAYIKESGESLAIATVVHTIKDIRGEYSATFVTEKGTKATVIVLVEEDVEVVDPITKETMKAKDFELSIDQAKEVLSKTSDQQKEQFIRYGKASAFDTATHANVEITKVTHDIIAERGVYEVTYQTEKGTTLTVNVLVSDQTVNEGTITEKISANNFTVSKEEVGKLTEENIIHLAKASAYIMETGEEVGIKVSGNNMQAKRGIYDVTFQTEKGTGITIQVTVLDQTSENTYTEVIQASDFMVSKEEVASLTKETILEKAKAKAYIKETKEEVAIVSITHTIKAKRGIYTATFISENGSTITVNVLVKGEVEEVDPVNQEKIKATDFMLSKEEANRLLTMTSSEQKAKLIVLGKAEARSTQSGGNVEIAKVTHDIEGTRGVYHVSYETAKGTRVTIYAMVSEQTISENTITEKISANSFTIAKEEVAEIRKEEMIRLAKARAEIIETGANVEITTIEHQIQANKGVYDVTFKTKKGSKVTVQATVKDRVHDSEYGERLSANNIELSVEEAKSITNQQLITKSDVQVENIETGVSVPIVKVKSDVQGKAGVYDVSFETKAGSSITISATVRAQKGNKNQMMGEANDDSNTTTVGNKNVNNKNGKQDSSTSGTSKVGYIDIVIVTAAMAFAIYIFKKEEEEASELQEKMIKYGTIGMAGISALLFVVWIVLQYPVTFTFWGDISLIQGVLLVLEIGYVYIYRMVIKKVL